MMVGQPALRRQLGDENGDENSQLSFLHWTAMNSIVMMNVARLDVFCQVGFLGSNIGHSGHFALVRKIGPATAGGWEERQPRCSKSQDEHHFTMMIWGLITGTWKPYHRFQTVFFLQKPKQLFILLSFLPFL